MSFIGKSPSLKRTRYEPQSTDPVNPQDGDFFFSDGTPRLEGPWVYFNGAWQQVSTSGALANVNNLTFTPQASDPGSPAEGMVFYADGTSRAEGLWLYQAGVWVSLSGQKYQEFYLKDYAAVRCATTSNVNLANALENGDIIDGVVLATGNRVLVKNQTTASENGVYVVPVSGPAARATDADTFSELNDYSVLVDSGTANRNTIWFQTTTLTSLSDSQVWATTPAAKTFVVPGVSEIYVEICGGGGGGGGGSNTASNGGGGGGGGGASVIQAPVLVTPGESLTVNIGSGKLGGLGGQTTPSNGSAGTAGADSTLTRGATVLLRALGGNAGSGGTTGPAGGAGGAGPALTNVLTLARSAGGAGAASPFISGSAGEPSIVQAAAPTNGGAGLSDGGGGGGGGNAVGLGGAGGTGEGGGAATNGAIGTRGSGGGGGGGGSAAVGGRGGPGGSGYIRISW